MDLELNLGYSRFEVQVQDEKASYFKKQDGDLAKLTDKQMNSEVSDVLTLIHDIQEHLNTFFKEFKQVSYERGVAKEEIIRSMKELTRAIDSHIENSLLGMYKKSIKNFLGIIKYLSLGMTFHEENVRTTESSQTCSVFDYYTSKNIYIMRHQAMEKYHAVPVQMQACLHPKLLACKKSPAIWRRANYISQVVIYLSKLAKNGKTQSSGSLNIELSLREKRENIILVETKALPSRKSYKSMMR